MNQLQATIREAFENAPPEHLELALAALIEARFNVWPREGKVDCGRRQDPPHPKTLDTFEWWTDWSGQVSGEGTLSSPRSLNT
jgi:hypothetical protein